MQSGNSATSAECNEFSYCKTNCSKQLAVFLKRFTELMISDQSEDQSSVICLVYNFICIKYRQRITLSLLVNERFEKLLRFLIASGRLEPTPIAARLGPQQRITRFSRYLSR